MTKPRKIKEKLGTLNVTRERRSQTDPQGYFIPDCEIPHWLSEEAKERFRDLFDQLNDLEILRGEDLAFLGMLAQAQADYIFVTDHLNSLPAQDRFLVEGSKGNEVRNPLLLVQKQLTEQVLNLSRMFAITPAFRAKANFRFAPEGEAASDDFSDL